MARMTRAERCPVERCRLCRAHVCALLLTRDGALRLPWLALLTAGLAYIIGT